MKCNFSIINDLETLLNGEFEVEVGPVLKINAGRKCRLLSHLLHRAGMDIHCNNQGYFTIDTQKWSMTEICEYFQAVVDNPQWIIGFVEKYADNEFMISSTFGKMAEV